MMPYLLHVSLLIAIVISLYKIILEKETHYKWNRWILLGAIFASFILPLLTVPSSWSLQPLWEKADNRVGESKIYTEQEIVPEIEPEMLGFSEKVDFPKEEKNLSSEQELVGNDLKNDSEQTSSWISIFKQITFFQWLGMIYGMGIVVFTLRLIIQIGVLIRQIKILPKKRDGKYILLEPRDEKASYSFFHYIFINPVPLDLATYGQILSHEKIHADQKHSLDILLAEILLIFQWYNPFAWMYRKSVRQNIEYLTDDVMVKNGADMTDYQMSLLRVSVPEYGYTMVANYNQSLLKRIL
ncbi:MAG: hypothetical protein R3B93_18035 [Bacteroidia bacterium]